MPAQPDIFRDFGILPENLPPPTGKVRAFLSPGRIAGQYLATGLVLGVGLLVMVLTALFQPMGLNVLAPLAALLGCGAIAFLATRNDYDWVELEGDVLRAHHLYTGQIVERKVQEIERLVTVVYHGGTVEGAMIQTLLGRIKGMQIKFRDKRTPLAVLRSDPAMTNAQQLLQGVLFRMAEIDELEADIGKHSGAPLVRNIHWKHEAPVIHPNDTGFNVVACVFILLGLMMGPVFGCVSEFERDSLELSRVPPHEITLAELIEKGPGENRHVTITNFEPGGYTAEVPSKQGTWINVYVAIFPQGGPQTEIKAVYSPKGINNEGQIRQLMMQAKLTGACSKTQRTTWGTDGTELSKHNGGANIGAAWTVTDISNPPSEALVRNLTLAAYGTLGLVLLASLAVFGKALAVNIAG